MVASPIFYQNQWPAVTVQTLSANGGANGLVTVPSTDGFFVLQIVKMANSTPKTEYFQVLEVVSDTQLYLGALSNVGDKRYRANGADLSAYTTALSSTILAEQQNKRLPSPQYVLPSAYMAEPISAHRSLLVNARGAPLYNRGDLKTIRNSAILTTGYVATQTLDIGNANAVMVLTQFTKGSLTNAMLRFDTSEDASTWFPCEMEKNGAVTASGDEAQTNNLATVHVLTPSTASLTTYAHILRADQGAVLGQYFRARILGTGTVTSSLAAIQAYACVL